MDELIIVKGGGDLATGIAHRLFRSGFQVMITEIPQPTVIRRTVAFASAIYSGKVTVEGVTAVRAQVDDICSLVNKRVIPVIIDQTADCVLKLRPGALVDAIIAKTNTGTTIQDAPIVIAAGPGFAAGIDVHAVIETSRGHDLGRVITNGSALADTRIPGNIGGYTIERLIKAPCSGKFRGICNIGDRVTDGKIVAYVDDAPVYANISGVLRGLLHDGLTVSKGMKVGDVDPRAKVEHCFTISDKARAIGGGVLEAIMMLKNKRENQLR